MKALVIAPQPFFTPRGTPFSVYYRTLVTSSLDVQVDLLTYGEGEDVEIPGVRIIRIPRFRMFGPVKTGPSALKLFLDVFVVLWTIGLLMRRRYDFVHAHEEAVFFCRFLKPLFGFKLVYDMHSSLPQQLTNFDYTRSRALAWIFTKLEDTSIRSADVVITICPELAEYALELMAVQGRQERHVLIENSIFDDVQLSSAGQAEDASVPELPRQKRFIVYAGTLESYQGIDLLIEAYAQAVRMLPDSFLVIVGGTPAQVEQYRSLAARFGVSGNCLFTGRVPQKMARRYNRLASVVVSPRSAGNNTPLKVYEQLAGGVPIVATRILSHTQVLDDTVAFLVEPTPEGLAGGLISALSCPADAQRRVEGAAQMYTEQYSRAAYEGKMRRMLELLA